MALRDQIGRILRSYVLPVYTIGFVILLVVMAMWLLHKYQTENYWKAKRARSAGDIALATRLFEEAVRQDAKGLSFKALLALMEIDEPCALEELIHLIDLPDLNWIVSDDRERMCEVIRKRTTGTTADSLPLDPRASQEVRSEEKRQWKTWLVKAKEQYDWHDGKFRPKEK